MDSPSKKLKDRGVKPKKKNRNHIDGKVSKSISINHAVHRVLKLPEILANIFRFLDVADKGRAAQVCVDWRNACEQPSVWRHIECGLHPVRPIPLTILKRLRIRKFAIKELESAIFLRSTLDMLFTKVSCMQSLKYVGYGKLSDAILRNTLPPLGLPHMTSLALSGIASSTDDSVDLITRLMPNLVFLKLRTWFLVTDKTLLFIAVRLRKLKTLDLHDCQKFTEKGFGYLAGKINAEDAKILQNHATSNESVNAGDPNVANLAVQGSSIATLNIRYLKVTDNAVRHLSDMTNLRRLTLSFCEVNDTGCAYLSKLVNLQELDLSGNHRVSDTGLLHVAKMTSLQMLKLYECRDITTTGIKYLHGSRIISLDVRRCSRFDREALCVIVEELSNLTCLWIDRTHTTPAGFWMAAKYLLNLKILSVGRLDQMADIVALRQSFRAVAR